LVPTKEADDEKLEKQTCKVSRNLFFIRHGQYNLKGDKDEAHTLTELGKYQLALSVSRFNS